MSRASFSPPRALSAAPSRKSRVSLAARSVFQVPKYNSILITKNRYAKSKASRMSTAERLNPLISPKNSLISPEKRLEQLINTLPKKIIKYLLDSESKQLEYTSMLLDMKKYIKNPDTFWQNWFKFKENFLADVELCKDEYERSKNPRYIREMCEKGFTKFSTGFSNIHSLHKESFLKSYAAKFKEINSYFNQLRKIIIEQLKRHSDDIIFCRDLQYVIVQLEGFKSLLPKEYDRFFAEPLVYSTEQNVTKQQVLQRALAPIDDIINSIKTYIDPSTVLKNARDDIMKQQTAIKKFIIFPETARQLQNEQKEKQAENEREKREKNNLKKKEKLEKDIEKLKKEKEQLRNRLSESVKESDETTKKIFQVSNEWSEEKKKISRVKYSKPKTLTSEQIEKKKKDLAAEIAKKKEELNKIVDEEQIDEQEKENDELIQEVKIIKKKFKTAEKSIVYQRALIKTKVDSFDNEQSKKPYIRNDDLAFKLNEMTDRLKTTRTLLLNLRKFAAKRSKVEQFELKAIPDPEKKFPKQFATNNKAIEKVKKLLENQCKLMQSLREAQMESSLTYAVEELNAEKGDEYEKVCEKLRNSIQKCNLPPDSRSLPLAAAETINEQAKIAAVQCQIDSIRGGKVGIEAMQAAKEQANTMIISIEAKEKALSAAVKKAQSADAPQKILAAAKAAEEEVEELKDEIDSYSDTFASIEKRLGIEVCEATLPERIRNVINALSK